MIFSFVLFIPCIIVASGSSSQPSGNKLHHPDSRHATYSYTDV